jgi:hypothetical protein
VQELRRVHLLSNYLLFLYNTSTCFFFSVVQVGLSLFARRGQNTATQKATTDCDIDWVDAASAYRTMQEKKRDGLACRYGTDWTSTEVGGTTSENPIVCSESKLFLVRSEVTLR